MRPRLLAALRNADRDVLLLLWGARPDADFADEATWRAASPHWSEDRRSLIARKYAAALAGVDEPEFDDPDPVRGWAAQYLNVWPLLVGRGDGILPNWSARATDEPPLAPAALGVAADVDQTWLSLGAASVGERPHLGSVLRLRVAEKARFVSEVARIQSQRGCAVVIDAKGPASFLIPDLEVAGVRLTQVGLDEFVQAGADLVNAVDVGDVTHGDYAELNAAVDAAGWRKVGDRRAFARKAGDISMLEAVSLAFSYTKQPQRTFWGAIG
jgi:hypothetical protein